MRRHYTGYTLVELTIATAIISAIILLMMNFMSVRIADNATKSARSSIQLQAQKAVDIISRDIKHSASVDGQNRWADNYAPDSPANNFSWSSDSDTLILAHPAISTDGQVLFQDAQGYVSYKDDFIYFIKDKILYKRILAAPVANNRATTTCPSGTTNCPADIKLADDVETFLVTYYATGEGAGNDPAPSRSVDVTLKINKKVFGKNIIEEIREHTTFRNQ
jgi:Tfp pilus assembly protein FimT